MRFLGSRPDREAGDLERIVMVELHRRIVKMKDKALDDAQRARS
jgi:hypothetical protein